MQYLLLSLPATVYVLLSLTATTIDVPVSFVASSISYCLFQSEHAPVSFVVMSSQSWQYLLSFSAPPSYNKSVFGKVNVKDEDDNEHTRGNLDYAPVYTYYDWGHHPTPMSGDGKQ